MSFSGAVRITDIQDYITPSQACVKPVPSPVVAKNAAGGAAGGAARVRLEIGEDDDGTRTYGEKNLDTGVVTPLAKAKITLDDCLACSGCVTSAESVLIEAQSHPVVLQVLQEGKRPVVVSVAPEARASLAQRYGVTLSAMQRALRTVFTQLGAQCVEETTAAALVEADAARREFVRRWRARDDHAWPLLASTCPGWVCYAEKTQGEWAIPHMSTVKSPQQIMGGLVKRKYGADAFHVTVMMCYDKKLEAARDDTVDCVLSSLEVVSLIEEQFGGRLPDDDAAAADANELVPATEDLLDVVYRYAAKELFGLDIKGPLETKVIRGTDYAETALVVDGKTVFTFATAYGFRSIQNIVRKVKRGKCSYDYVQVMACPSGCINGGGQVRADPPGPRQQQDLVERIRKAIGEQTRPLTVVDSAGVSAEDDELIYTSFKAVPKMDMDSGAGLIMAANDW